MKSNERLILDILCTSPVFGILFLLLKLTPLFILFIFTTGIFSIIMLFQMVKRNDYLWVVAWLLLSYFAAIFYYITEVRGNLDKKPIFEKETKKEKKESGLAEL